MGVILIKIYVNV